MIDFIKSVSNKEMSFTINTSEDTTKNHEEDLILTTVLTDQIQQVTNSAGKSNYSFIMERVSNFTGTYFLNLVVKEYKDTFYTYIVKYVPDTNWLASYSAKTSFNSFTGSTYYYSIDGNYIATIDMQNGVSTTVSKSCDSGTGSGSTGGGGGNTDNSAGSPFPNTNTGNFPGSGGGSVSCEIIGVQVPCNQVQLTGGCLYETEYVVTCEIVGQKSMKNFIDSPCTPETECHNEVGDPCSCNTSGDGCEEDTTEDENSDVGVIIDLDNPCNRYNILENNEGFKEKMQNLQNLAQTDNKETAFKMTTDGTGDYDYSDPIEGEPNSDGLDPQVVEGEVIDGFIHNHYDREGKLSVFSPHDLYALYVWLRDGNIGNTFTFVYAVTTPDNTNYAITITDPTAFINFGDIALEGLQNEDNEIVLDEYEGDENTLLENDGGIKDDNTNDLNEKNFLKLLTAGNTGLTVYKPDTNFENWQQLNYDSTTDEVIPQDCN